MIKILPDIIDVSTQKFPEKKAFICGATSLSFKEMQQKINQLAAYLQILEVKKGDRVGIYMERSIESFIAVYGIMKVGAVFVPLDPTAPRTRTLLLLNDCGIKHIITTTLQSKKVLKFLSEKQPLQSIIGCPKETTIPTVSWDFIYNLSLEQYVPVQVQESDLAYIMYTSGSTGAPKGIMHTHYSGLNYAKLSLELYKISEKDRVATFPPLHFDQSTFGYFTSPLASASTIIIQDAYTKLPASLSQLMEDQKISIWYSVPLILIQLVQKGLLEDRDLSSLRWVLFGGEVFIAKYLRQLMVKWPQAKFCNVYGPAEINQCSYYHLSTPLDIEDPMPIGYIWDDTEYKIVDKNDQEVAQGDSGQLVVHTTTMMKGYWNNEALTKKSFYEDNGKIYYKTGDIFRLAENGKLMFLGRNDYQVKIRGYRVEITEIESVIVRHDGIEEAAVLVLNGDNGEKELVATVLTKPNVSITERELIAYCKRSLSSYAVPSTIHILDTYPRTSSAKIDKGALKRILIEK